MPTHDGPDGESVRTYELSDDEAFSRAVVAVAAEMTGRDPAPGVSAGSESKSALEPLHAVVDPDALDAIFRPDSDDTTGADGRITFSYHGCEITIHSEGRVSARRLETATGESAD